MIVNFQELKLHGSKSGKCVVCGKHCKRQEIFSQTLNPFNRNKRGEPKTESEIYTELKEAVKKWKKEPVKHSGCE